MAEVKCCETQFVLYLLVIVGLVVFAGLMAGLTLGLMSLGIVDLEVLIQSGRPKDRIHASKIFPVVKNQHLLLCTLLIGNALAMESLPIFLDKLVPPWAAVLTYSKLDNLNITGNLGYQLDSFHHLRQLDVSNNNIYGEIPFGLPLNLTHLNLACNNLSQYIPYSLSSLKYLRHMNLSHNFLTGPVGNVFTGLICLTEMDLSYNQFIGDLPSSFGTLHDCQCAFMNIQDNHFSGIIPKQFQYIHNLWIGGNMFDIGGSPAWDFPLDNPIEQQNITTPPSTESSAVESYPLPESAMQKKKKMGKKIAIIIVGSTLVAACLLLFFMHRFHKCGRKLRRPESNEGSQHSLPISMARGKPHEDIDCQT